MWESLLSPYFMHCWGGGAGKGLEGRGLVSACQYGEE